MLIDRIKSLSLKYYPKVVEFRSHLHAHPELSFQEFNTASFIQTELTRIGVPWETCATTGVVAQLKGTLPSENAIALRADIDALPIQETEGREYGSTVPGVMHACGHDVHTASLLGVIHILNDLKDEFGGTISFIFQPGEEKLPGGASLMIKEGLLKKIPAEQILAQHVLPQLEVGKVGFRPGKYMASTDELYLTIKGKGGHGAQPQQTIDPIAIAAQVITALQQVVSRIADPRMPSVLTFGKILGLGATNIIPDEVKMEGTFRTLNEEWRNLAHEKMREITEAIVKGFGAECKFEIRRGYPALVNEERLTKEIRTYAEEYVGAENVIDLDLWMAGEDFAFFAQEISGCYYRLGTGNKEKGITSPVHTSTFDIDTEALKISTGLMAFLALRQLGNR